MRAPFLLPVTSVPAVEMHYGLPLRTVVRKISLVAVFGGLEMR